MVIGTIIIQNKHVVHPKQASGNWDHNHPKLVPQSTCSKRRDPGVDYHPGVVRRFEHVDCLQVATSDAVGQDVIIGTIISQSKQVVIGTIISQSKQVIFGMNGVKIKRHGLILWENDATGLKIVLEWFPGLNNPLKKSKIDKKIDNSRNPYSFRPRPICWEWF